MASSARQRTSLTFHVPPDAGPDDTLALLQTLDDNPDVSFETYKDLSAWAESNYGAGGRKNDAHKMAQIAGLLTRDGRTPTGDGASIITLTPLGRQLLSVRRERCFEVAHFILYTGWERHHGEAQGPLWSYRTICDTLWTHAEINVSEMNRAITNTVSSQIDEEFPQHSKDLSFGPKSVAGVIRWLERLEPPAVQQKVFRRRASCSAELMLLALGWVYRDVLPAAGADAGGPADLLLTAERREALCRVCLLDPAHLDRLLDWTVSVYPRYVGEGTRAGSLGRFLRLYRAPRLEDSNWII